MTEARLERTADGWLEPQSDGWFVLNARDSGWLDGDLGKYTGFESREARFPQLGVNINVMHPGEPMTMYHRENVQEDFLVIEGECLLIVEGEERPLKRWDLFHCPAGVAHAIVGAGEGRSIVIAVGARGQEERGLVYPADPAAQRHGAGPERDVTDPAEAYRRFTFRRCRYEEGWLPG